MLHSYNIIQDPNLTDIVFIRKQTRKFKNRRWVKKYRKKYSKIVPSKEVMIIEQTQTMIMHPATYHTLRNIGGAGKIKLNFSRPEHVMEKLKPKKLKPKKIKMDWRVQFDFGSLVSPRSIINTACCS